LKRTGFATDKEHVATAPHIVAKSRPALSRADC
jgi:hypothetical protein